MTMRDCCIDCPFGDLLSCISKCPVRIAYDEDPEGWIIEHKRRRKILANSPDCEG